RAGSRRCSAWTRCSAPTCRKRPPSWPRPPGPIRFCSRAARAPPPRRLETEMEQSWRWFGPGDVVPLHAIRQAGASGVVTALHQIPYGELWTEAAIAERQSLIAADASLGLRWNVAESLPIHERIKLGEGDLT